MPVFHYEGSVTPDAVPLTLDYVPTARRTEAASSPDAEFSVRVTAGRVRIRVETEEFSEDVVHALFLPALDCANALVEMAGFIMAIPYSVEIERVEYPDKTIRQFVLGDRSLAATHNFDIDDLEELADLALLDLKVGLLISDTLMSLGRPHYSPIACGRITDGIARLVAPDAKPKARWEKLRTCLRVDESFLRSLTDVSKAGRHADRVEVIAEINKETAHRAWTLVSRYLHYRKKGSLNPEEYPVLEGEHVSLAGYD